MAAATEPIIKTLQLRLQPLAKNLCTEFHKNRSHGAVSDIRSQTDRPGLHIRCSFFNTEKTPNKSPVRV